MNILEVQNLSFKYFEEEDLILKDINFFVEGGELIQICGESGCGKSTFLKCLSGVIPHYIQGHLEGEIFLDGKSIFSMDITDIVTKVGMLFQDVDSQIINLNVKDEIIFGMENIGIDIEEIDNRVDKIMPFVNLSEDDVISTLSGGQKQRVAIASILTMLPKIILMDEPLANLDNKSSEELLKSLKILCASGKTVIMVEHRMDLAKEYVDRLIYIEKGQIVKDLNSREDIKTLEKEKIKKYTENKEKIIFKEIEDFSKEKYALEIENLNFNYGNNQILENLNMKVLQGDRVGIIGENGCGKSTFLKILCKVNEGKRGNTLNYLKYNILNRDLNAVDKKFINKNIGFVFQNPNHQLFMDSVYNEIELNAENQQHVEEIIELFNLEDLRYRHPLSLSQGQKRLLAIAAIVVAKPAILLLDEPTIGQDYESLYKILDVLSLISKKYSMTVITVTHDNKVLERLCNKIYMFDDKKCIKSYLQK